MGSKRKRQAPESSISAPATKKSRKSKKSKGGASSENKEKEEVVIEAVPFLENPRGQDLKAEVRLYELLSSEDAGERERAAIGILSGLFGGEDVKAAEGESEFDGVSAATLQRHLERRLFRGLASGRKGARLGFSVVLSEVLSRLFGGEEEEKYKELDFEKVVGILLAKTKPQGDLSGQEEKDHYLGLLFGLKSFVRGKILFGDEWENRWSTILDSLFRLSEKKPWIREEVGSVIMEAVDQMSQEQAEMTIQKLVEARLAASPEGVGIWLEAKSRFPDMRLPNKPWGSNGDPLQHLKDLALALKESSKAGDGQVKQSGNWNAQPHFVWNVVFGRYLQRAEDRDDSVKSDFQAFWKVIVDDSLFSESATPERKFWGFLLFQKMLQDAADHTEIFSGIFTANLVRCLINQLASEDRFLHRAADKSTKTLLQVVEAKPHVATIVLENLVSNNGVYHFDRVTKSKTIDKLISGLSGKNAGKAVEILLSGIVSLDPEDTKEAEAQRILFGEYLSTMIRRSDFSNDALDHEWIEKTALPTLARLAYCNEEPKCTPPLSEKSRELFKTSLASALAYLISFPKGFSYPTELLKKFTPDVLNMDEEVAATKDRAFSTMKKLLKKSEKAGEQTKGHLRALVLLYALVIFQVYNGEPDAVSVLDEICYEKLVPGKDSEESEFDASEVLVEILLSFVSKPSALLRKAAQYVFSAFAGVISLEGLMLMTDILEKGESLKGQQELFDQDQDNEMDIDENEDSSELDSDVEIVETSDDEEAEDEDDDAENELKAELDRVLGNPGEGSSSDSDADMTDSEMMALDEKLKEIFAQRTKIPNKKREKKDAKETMVNFKSRVLDLLDIYVKQQTCNPLAFQLLLPLLTLMRRSNDKTLIEKAYGVIIDFATASKKVKKELCADSFNAPEQFKLLKSIHEEAPKDPSHAYQRAASTASQLTATNLLRLDKGNFKKVAEVYFDTEIRCMKGEIKVHASFFHDYVNWFQSHCG